MTASAKPQAGFYEVVRMRFTEAVPHVRECGIVVEQLDASGARVRLPYRRDWLGDTQRGRIHTGIITSLVDTASGLAVLAAIGQFEAIATLDLRMDYLRAAVPDRPLLCRAESCRLTRSIVFIRAWVWQDDEREPVALSQSSFMRSSHSPRRGRRTI